MRDRAKAQELHERARTLAHEGKEDDAIQLYQEAIELDPDKSESFYNIGLIYKYRGDWLKSLEFNKRANELDRADEAARWNLAIAATALRDWKTARQAWLDQGFSLESGEGPIALDFGPTPVRLNPVNGGEVVWATRIDPVRAQIDNIPLPESGFRFGDVVLHDGAVTGSRTRNGREYGVFNVLELFERSNLFTVAATVEVSSRSDLENLEQTFKTADVPLEIWTTNVHAVCRQCSEGSPHEHHDSELKHATQKEYRVGIATNDRGKAEVLLTRWQAGSTAKITSIATYLDH